MKAPAIFAAVLLAGAARAQTPPAAESPPDKPPAVAPAEAPVAPVAPAKEQAAAVGYEPGVGLRYKSPTTTVVLYGLLDMTLSTVDNADKQGDRKTSYQSAWFSGNRWGINGSQGLVPDKSLKAIFRLESEYVLNTGEMDTPGVLFNRDAWIGFDSVLGKITFGRQNSLARDFSQNYGDPYGSPKTTLEEGGWTNNNNFKQLIFYAGSVTGTRMNNGLVWKKEFGGRVVAGLGYQFGGVPGAFPKNSTLSAALAYNGGPFNVSGFVTDANVNGLTHRSVSIGGNVKYWLVRLDAGYFHYWASQGAMGQRTDNAFTVSAKVAPVGDFEFHLGYQVLKADNAAYSAAGNTLNPFADASSATSAGSGRKSTLYASVFYRFNKITEAYVAADHMILKGGYKVAVTNGFDDQTEIGVGLRLRF